MKFVKFQHEGRDTYGILEEGSVELIEGSPYGGSTKSTGKKVQISNYSYKNCQHGSNDISIHHRGHGFIRQRGYEGRYNNGA